MMDQLKKFLSCFLLLLVTFSMDSTAQTSIKFGGFERVEKDFFGKEIVLERGTDLFVLDKEDKNIDLVLFQFSKAPFIYLKRFNSTTFEIKNSVRILFPAKKKTKYEYAFMKLMNVNGQLLLFVKAKNSKTKQLKLLVQKLNDE